MAMAVIRCLLVAHILISLSCSLKREVGCSENDGRGSHCCCSFSSDIGTWILGVDVVNSTRCVPRDERFGHLKMSDFLAHSLKAIVQFLVPELKSLFDSTMNEFDSFKDIKKPFSDGKNLPNNSILEAAKNFIPFELVKEFLTTDGEKLFKYPLPQVIARMKSIAGSVTGGTKDIQEMLEFCAKERVYPNIEVIPIQYINEALERMINKDVKYRFVIDIENSLVSN